MSFADPVCMPLQCERRSQARRRVDDLVYLDFSSDNGAILVDLSEGGLGFQSVVPMTSDHAFLLKFKLTGRGTESIETYAEVTWVRQSAKRGGLRFVELSAHARAQICSWIGVQAPPEGAAVQASDASAGAGSAQAAKVGPEIATELGVNEGVTSQGAADQVAANLDTFPVLGFMHDAEDFTLDSTLPLLAPAPWKPVPGLASDSDNSLPVQRRARMPAFSKPKLPFRAANQEPSTLPGSFIQQSSRPAAEVPQLERPPGRQKGTLTCKATLASQALRVGIGAAAGASLVLAFVALVPALRTRIQAIANATSNGSNLVNSPVFQVEVIDRGNRRWSLGSASEAASPVGGILSHRETQSANSGAVRSESTKASFSVNSGTASDVSDESQPKSARPDKLVLPRPHSPQPPTAPAQVMVPSIFEGITPPFGSVIDRLTSNGPDAPAPKQPSVLRAAALVQRVEPVYPKIALESRVSGQVRLSANIGRDGVPRVVKVISGDPRLVYAARAAVNQWRYRPATLGSEPIEMQTIVSIDFELH